MRGEILKRQKSGVFQQDRCGSILNEQDICKAFLICGT